MAKKYSRTLLLFILIGHSIPLFAYKNNKIIDSLLHKFDKINSQNKPEEAELVNSLILKLSIEQNDKAVQIKALNNLSFFYVYKNDYLKAFNYSEQAISLANELKNDTILANLYISKSKLFSKTDNIDGSIKYLLKAKKIVFTLNNNESYCDYYNALAHFYYEVKEYNKAIECYKLALLKRIHLKDLTSFRSYFDNIGLCYRNMKDFKTAEYYFKKAIYFSKKYHTPVGLVNASINLSINYYKSERLDEALAVAKNTLDIIKHNEIPINFSIEISTTLAKIYLQQKDYVRTDSALNIINNLLKNRNVLDKDKLNYLKVLCKKYKATKSPLYISSFEHFLMAKDSLDNLRMIRIENSINDKFIIAEKLEDYENIQHNLDLQEAENKWIIAFGLIFLAGLIILFYLIYKAKHHIKELKLLHNKIDTQNKNLELYNKQKDYILATVAHDLRGPVGNINTITSVISLDQTLNQENKNLIQLINQSADLSLSIINDLVDAINVDRKNVLLKEDKIVLTDVIRTVLEMQSENLNRKKINVQLDCFPGLEIKGDKNFIIRVLFNIISNAAKFSNTNTEILIETLLYDENNVLIKIKDQGIGIASENLSTIFEPFTAASRRGIAGEKSIGLGLSICKKIVDLHHGKIWAESKPNEGSDFFIILPLNYLNQILKNIPFNL